MVMLRSAGLRAVVVAVVALLSASTPTRDASAGAIPEISAPWLEDIAMATMTPNGPVIYVNVGRCKEVGPNICAFVRHHEYGHIRLNHASAFYTSYVNGRALAEAEADCFAAKNALLVQVKAAIAHFEQPPLDKLDVGEHGTGLQRAKRIKVCRGL
jgi:hypothetical protein